MAANVESMFYVREVPWHGLGTRVEEALTSADALRIAGLDWLVEQKPIQVCGGNRIENFKANIRSTDGKVLGVVSDRYQIVQNVEAFDFTDELIGGDVRYETAGSLQEGRKVWMLAKMPTTKIVGDDVEPYLCFSNTHDGSGAIRICMTPIRVVCNNTLNLAFNGAHRQWSTRHTGDLKYKMREARLCLELAEQYMDGLASYADRLANTTITDEQLDKLLAEMFPVDEEKDGERKKNSVKKAKEEFMICYFRPDIAQFLHTGWGVVNAMSDMATHSAPRRKTANYQENNWGRIMDGHPLLDKMTALVGAR